MRLSLSCFPNRAFVLSSSSDQLIQNRLLRHPNARARLKSWGSSTCDVQRGDQKVNLKLQHVRIMRNGLDRLGSRPGKLGLRLLWTRFSLHQGQIQKNGLTKGE